MNLCVLRASVVNIVAKWAQNEGIPQPSTDEIAGDRGGPAVEGTPMVDPIFLPDVETQARKGPAGQRLRAMEAAGMPVPPIWNLLAYKPEATEHLNRYTQAVMRGPSELSSGTRELIAAFTSTENQCVF